MDTGLILAKGIEGFVLACRACRLSPNTLIGYSRMLKRFRAFTGVLVLVAIMPGQISAFLAA